MRRPASHSRRAGAAAALALLLLAPLASDCDAVVSLSGLEGGCPPAKHGAEQVKVTLGSQAYCIDATEVTNAQYLEFTRSGYPLAQADDAGVCSAVTGPGLVPSANWPAGSGEESYPVNNVNWCQAYTFCQWAGKRLCGAIGGGPLAAASVEDVVNPPVVNEAKAVTLAGLSQWFNACSAGGTLTYPYGENFDQTACDGQLEGGVSQQIANVASDAKCVGSVPGLHDMSGSVWEWTDTCGDNGFCFTFGGAFDSTSSELECLGERDWSRNAGANNIGFRCCSDL